MAYGDIVSSGTVSGSSGSTTVTGASTAWASGPLPLRAGDQLYVGGYVYPITAVASDTSLTIGVPLQAAVSGGTSYRAVLAAPTRQTVAEVSSSIGDLVKAAQFLTQSGGPIRCAGIGTNTPPSSPATDDTYVIGTSPTGAWAGQGGNFARWTGSAWYIEAAGLGAMAVDPNGADIYFKTTGGWVARSMSAGAVRYDTAQSLSSSQKSQARTNVGAQFFSGIGYDISGLDLHSLSGAVRTDAGFMWGIGVTNAPSDAHWTYLKLAANGSSDYFFLLAFSWYNEDGSGKPMVKYKRLKSGATYSPWYSVNLT